MLFSGISGASSEFSSILSKTDDVGVKSSLEIIVNARLHIMNNVAIIAVIGSGMRGKVGIASRVFLAAQKANSNVMMIAQGSSELNLAFVVKDNDCKAVVESLHKEFKLNSLK